MSTIKQWFQAIKSNDLEFVEAHLREYSKTTDSNYPYYTGLMQATAAGHMRMVRLLLDSEARTTTRTGWTALMTAAETNQVALVRLLVVHEKGMQTIRPTNHYRVGTTALLVAATKGHLEIVKILYEHEVKASNWNPLFLAALTHNSKDIREHLSAAATRVDTYNRTPLMYCVMHLALGPPALANDALELTRAIELLGPLNEGATDYHGKTALIYATEANNGLAVEALLNYTTKEAGCKTVSVDGKTALMIAAEKGYTKLCSLLAESEKRMMTSKGLTALMYAAVNGHAEIVQLLAPLEVDMHIIEDVPPFTAGMRAIDMAKASNFQNIVEILRIADENLQLPQSDAPSINLERAYEAEDYSRTSEMDNLLSVKKRHGFSILRNPVVPLKGCTPQDMVSVWSPSLSYIQSNRLTGSLGKSGLNNELESKPASGSFLMSNIEPLQLSDAAQAHSEPVTSASIQTYSILNKLNGAISSRMVKASEEPFANKPLAAYTEISTVSESRIDNNEDKDRDELGRFLTRKRQGLSADTVHNAAHSTTVNSNNIPSQVSVAEVTFIEPPVIPSTSSMFSKKEASRTTEVLRDISSQDAKQGSDFLRVESVTGLPMDDTVSQIAEQLKTTKQLLNNYAADNMKLLETISELRAELQQEEDDKQVLLDKLAVLKSKETTMQTATSAATMQREEYEKRYNELKKNNAEVELKAAQYYTENIELKSELEEFKRQVDALLRENNELKRKVDRFDSSIRDTHQRATSNPLSRSALTTSIVCSGENVENKHLAADIKDLKDELAELTIKRENLANTANGLNNEKNDATDSSSSSIMHEIIEDIMVDHHQLAIFMPKYNRYIHLSTLSPIVRQFLINNKFLLNDLVVERQENERMTDYTIYLREEVNALKERVGRYETSLMNRGAK
ncbi:Protein 21.1 [Giardia lamblia P15]|uniref:Protein 21.1 n=1 Tax=Giardia intestinalis (strain P15) TaxID=658858 RepID=E1F5P3_GIAIA|nr:Protein 21.1 [Giardia lamblia P15]